MRKKGCTCQPSFCIVLFDIIAEKSERDYTTLITYLLTATIQYSTIHNAFLLAEDVSECEMETRDVGRGPAALVCYSPGTVIRAPLLPVK